MTKIWIAFSLFGTIEEFTINYKDHVHNISCSKIDINVLLTCDSSSLHFFVLDQDMDGFTHSLNDTSS